MMDGAYFTGRKEILEWINQTCALGITKIEQTCTGAIACQLLDAHFPGNVQMSKLNWEARSDYEVKLRRARDGRSSYPRGPL